MLKELKRDEWVKSYPLIPAIPENLLVKTSMLVQIKGHPSTKCRYFVAGDFSSAEAFMIVVRTEEHVQETWNSISVNSPTGGPIDDETMDKILKEFGDMAGNPFEISNQFLSGFRRNAEKLTELAHRNFNHDYKLFGAYLYYTDKAALSSAVAPTLHNDYHFDGPRLDVDVAKILENYQHSYPQTLESIGNRLKHLPSVFVRHTATDELAGYMMVDEFGFVTLQFTYASHRGHGIGQAIEFRLLEECIRFGIEMPFKMIEHYNDQLIQRHKASRLWKCCVNEDGMPRDFAFFVSKNRQQC